MSMNDRASNGQGDGYELETKTKRKNVEGTKRQFLSEKKLCVIEIIKIQLHMVLPCNVVVIQCEAVMSNASLDSREAWHKYFY